MIFVGDIVIHVSGSARMRVTSICGVMAACEWDDGQILRRRSYRHAELIPCTSAQHELDLGDAAPIDVSATREPRGGGPHG